MTGRFTALDNGGLDVSFNSNSSVFAKTCIETHSYFNQLMFYELDDLLPGELNICELF